jgi:hypothetical protein
VLDINPREGSKGSNGRKRGVIVCPRVMTFIRKLSEFEAKIGNYFIRYTYVMILRNFFLTL